MSGAPRRCGLQRSLLMTGTMLRWMLPALLCKFPRMTSLPGPVGGSSSQSRRGIVFPDFNNAAVQASLAEALPSCCGIALPTLLLGLFFCHFRPCLSLHLFSDTDTLWILFALPMFLQFLYSNVVACLLHFLPSWLLNLHAPWPLFSLICGFFQRPDICGSRAPHPWEQPFRPVLDC